MIRIARGSVSIALSLALALAGALVAGCGQARLAEEASTSAGAESTGSVSDDVESERIETTAVADEAAVAPAAAPAVTGAGASVRARTQAVDPIVAVPRAEPVPWRGHEWAIAPAIAPRVMLATVQLPPGDAFRPPATSCQDVILFVREGQLQATGTGVGPSDAPVTLYPGDAARFGPEGDGMAVNVGTTRARTVMAIARRPGTGAARLPPPHDDDCSVAAAAVDPLVRPLRVASIATTPPVSSGGSGLEVRVLLDEDSAGAAHGALAWLEGAPDLVLPEHRHEGAAEILFVEQGEGTIRIDGRDVAVRAGSSIYVPDGALHSFRSAGTTPLRALQVYAPAPTR